MNYSHFKSLIITIILIFKKKLPKSRLFISIFLLVKFNGILTLINPFEHKYTSFFTTYNLFHSLTFYAGLSRPNLNPIPYLSLCILIQTITIIPIFLCILLFFKHNAFNLKKQSKHKQKENQYNNNINISYNNYFVELELTKLQETIVNIVMWMFLFICVFSQHLVEILGFCYGMYIDNNKLSDEYLVNMKRRNFLSFTIVNSIFIIIINLYLVSFYLFITNKSFSENNNSFTHYHNYMSLLIMIPIYNAQMIHYFPTIFKSQQFNIISIIICEICLLILIVFFIKSYGKNNYYTTLYILFVLFTFFSGVICTIIQISNTMILINVESYADCLFILKIVVNILFTYVSYIFIKKYQYRKYDRIIAMNLFTKNKNISTNEYIYRLIEILDDIQSNTINISKLCSLITHHTHICTNLDKCASYLLSIETILLHVKHSALSKSTSIHLFNTEAEFINEFLMILLFIENEISNLISSIHLRRHITNNLDILLLHCSYVFFYEKNVTYSLYLLENYISKIKYIPFEYLIHFIELKKHILIYDNNTKKSSNNLFLSDCKFHNFYIYYQNLEQIKYLLYNNCIHYQKLIRYKGVYTNLQKRNNENKNEALKNKNQKHLIDKIFYACMIITKTTQSLKRIIYFKYNQKLLSNPEICYLLTLFFELTEKSSLSEMENYFSIIETYDQMDLFEYSYNDVKFEHPLIFGMNNNVIVYISEKLSENLCYNVNELKETDVNILLPSLFYEYHSIEMKRSLLIKQTLSIKKKVFILDKENYARKAFIHGGLLPTFNSHLLVICDISIIEDSISDDYLFILDSSMDIIAYTRDFEEKYKITMEMCSKLKFNFCSLFNVSFDNIYKTYKKVIECIRKRNIVDIKDLIQTFCYSDFKYIINAYSEEKDNFQTQQMIIIKNKKVLMNFIEKVTNSILEEKSDNDWKDRIEYIKELIKKESKHFNSHFEISLSLHYLANYVYFQARIHDKEKYNYFNYKANTIYENTLISKTPLLCSSPRSNLRKRTKHTKSNKTLYLISSTPLNTDKDNFFNHPHLSKTNFSLFNENSKRYPSNNDISINNNNSHNNSSTQQMLCFDSSQRLHLSKAVIINENSSQQIENNSYDYKDISLKTALTDVNQKEESIALYYKLKYLTKMEKVLLYICFVIIVLFSIMNILSYVFKIQWIGELENFIHIDLFIVKLKQYLLDVSLNISQGCYITDNITTGEVDNVSLNHVTINFLITFGSNNFFVAYKNLQSFISNYTDEPLIQEINSILYEQNEYTILNNDFSIMKFNSTFDEQLHYYHYSTGMLSMSSQSFNICRVKDLFIYKNLTNTSNQTASVSEKTMFFISNNIILDFFDKTDRMITDANNFLTIREVYNSNRTKTYNITLIMFGFVMCFILFFIVVIYQNKITTHLKQFFTFHNKNGMFEIQLELYRKMILNLDYENSYRFENARRHKNKSLLKHKSSSSILKNKKSNSRLNNNNSTSNFQQKLIKTFHHQKSIRSYQRHKYQQKKKEKEELNISNTSFNIYDNNLHIFSIKDFSFSFFSISIVTKSLIIILFCFLCHLGIHIANLLEDELIFRNIRLATALSFYYTDKVPAHTEILLNHRFAILENDIEICYIPFEDYSIYLPDYGLSPEEIEFQLFQDEKYIIMGQTQMTLLYFRMNMENSIVLQTEALESEPVLPLRYEFSKKLKLQEGVCDVVTEEYVKGGFTMFEGYNESYNLYACHQLAQGAADNGSLNSMVSFMTILQDEFLDFINSYKSNGNPPEVLFQMLSSDLFLSIYYQFTFLYNPSWIITNDLVQADIVGLFKDVKEKEVFFYIFEVLICVLYFLVFFLVILRLLRKKEIYFGEIIGNLSKLID